MKFIFSIPFLLIVLTGGDIAMASQLESEHQANLPIELALEKQDNQTSSNTDSVNFVKAVRNLMVTDIYSLDSDLSIIVSGPSVNFGTNVQIQTVIEQPNRFKSNIQFVDPNGIASKQYVITSDGQQVWVYDSSQNIYSVMTYGNFTDNYSDGFLVGLFTSFLLEVLKSTEDVREAFSSISEEELLQDESLVREIEAGLKAENSTIGSEIVSGVQYTTVTFDNPQDGLTVTLLIDPTTSLIEGIRGVSQDEALNVVMEEDITHKIPPASTSQASFTFLPPNGAQLSETPVSIDPF